MLEDIEKLSKQVCARCRRTGASTNPCPRKHKGAYLAFTSASGAECLPCRNYYNGCCKGMTKQQLSQDLLDDGHHKEYMASLAEHERLFDESAGQLRNAGGKIRMPEWIQSVEEHGVEGRQSLGIFWPKEVYEATGQVLDKRDEDTYVMGHKRIKGLYRDPSHGCPMGCIEVFKTQSNKNQRIVQVDSSEMAVRKHQLDDAWKSTLASADIAVKKVKSQDPEQEDKLRFVTKKSRAADKDDDSVDWEDVVKPAFMCVESSSSSSDDRTPPKRKQ